MTYVVPRKISANIPFSRTGAAIVSHWPLSENDGDSYDLCGVANLTVTGAPAGTAGPSTQIPRGRLFDGVNDYLTAPDAYGEVYGQATDEWHVIAWVKQTSTTGTQYIVGQSDTTASERGWALNMAGGSSVWQLAIRNSTNTGWALINSAATLDTTNWHMIYGAYAGGQGHISVDAETVVSTTCTRRDANAKFFIGAQGEGSFPFDGAIASVTMFKADLGGAFPAGTLSNYYNSGNGMVTAAGAGWHV